MFNCVKTLAIYVSDLQKAKQFYTEILGFEVLAEVTSNLCFLKSRSGEINIYLEGGKKPASIDQNTSRLSFFLQAEKSASETYGALGEAGVKLLQAPEFVGDNTLCFQFEDPDGNIIEVSGSQRTKNESEEASTPPFPSSKEEWQRAVDKALNLSTGEGITRYQGGTFPIEELIGWIRQEFSEGKNYLPDFVPALIRNRKGLVAWVYGDGSEPYWPGRDGD